MAVSKKPAERPAPGSKWLNWIDLPLRSDIGFGWLFAITLLLLAQEMLPVGWKVNEMHYFDLGLRFTHPERFTEYHAVFDGLTFRSLGLYLIGYSVAWLGHETAHAVLAFGLWLAMSAAVAFALNAMRVSVVVLVLAMLAFLKNGQELMGGEWIFDAVEGKVFAYVAVFAALGFVLRGRLLGAAVLLALAAYMHFLVGGFWGIALIFLAMVLGHRGRALGGMAALFVLSVLPLGWILLSGRFGVSLDYSGVDLTVNQIYSGYRHAHHVAPFESAAIFERFWRVGAIWTALLAAALLALAAIRVWPRRSEALWLGGVTAYLVLAFGLAYLDREAHHFGTLYLFRPSSLGLLLALLVLIDGALSLAPLLLRRVAAIAFLFLMLLDVVPDVVEQAQLSARAPTLLAALTEDEEALLIWTKENTPPRAVVFLAEWPKLSQYQREVAHLGFERLSGRATLVNYKFVPTSPEDLLRWYRLVNWSKDVATDGCTALLEQPVDYVVLRAGSEMRDPLQDCAAPAWQNDAFEVLEVRRVPA
ncbi:putative transmembrane protein [Candidatus Rhodobacter oscarellae]|uniref:Putative transmembrane protein n=1 Tax=Candidatus Rhodobacter oscarellae TaxID=1675527 RepID=A0A0J9EAT5_9RHOB|nr:DUF6798 domain-containing protein [Candidatus Rhodobacter lobularis]KMW59731.1 putative transmembrane protein [Candidatus Rhodobacter lobularis]